MRDVWMEAKYDPTEKKINKKKLIVTTLIIGLIVLSIVIGGVYHSNRQVRNWIDKNIFRKEVLEDRSTIINLKEDQNINVFSFNKYIGILNKTKLDIYGNTGNKEESLEIQVSNPIFYSSNRFLTIGEKKGQKVYLLEDKNIAWENSIEGNISQVYVNKNGYVAVVIVDTSYKTVIKVYSPKGKEIFNTYLSFTRAVDVSISNDNKYLAIAEVDTTGTIIQSNVKVISVEKAKSDPTNSLDNVYRSEAGKLITNICYQDKNKLVCRYTDSIDIIENSENKTLVDNKDKKIIFQSISLNNFVCSIEEKSSGLFTADSVVNIINTDNKENKQYVADSVTKEIYTSGNIIALNLGTEVEFVNTSGWLVKRYVANQEITNIVLSDNIAGIIYRDKIEIINL